MVDAHQQAEQDVEDDPCADPGALLDGAAWEADGGEEEGDCWEEEPGFLVGEDGQHGDAAEGGVEGYCPAGAEDEEEGGGAEELGEVDEDVLVVRVYAMLGEVRGVGVV